MAEVTIVIPNYNGLDFLEGCLKSLRGQSFGDFDIIVVDNGSTDGGPEFVEREYPEVLLKRLDTNYGFCRAVNEGIYLTKTPFVILLNNDTEADPDFVAGLLKEIKKDERLFSVASKMIQFHQRDRIDDAGDLYCALGWAFALGKNKGLSSYNKPARIFSACGGASIYRRQVFEEIGYFDELHFAYLEDVDVGYRARILGYQNGYTPEAVVYHVGSGFSGSRYNSFKVRLSARNSLYLIYKNMPYFQIFINLPFLLAGFSIKALFFILKGYGREYLSGIKRGYLLCTEGKKLEFSRRNIGNYIVIQLELWGNMLRRILG